MGRSTTIKNDKELEICDRHRFGFTYTIRLPLKQKIAVFDNVLRKSVNLNAKIM